MSEPTNGPWLVRLGEREERVEDIAALAAMVRSGRVGRATRVLGPGLSQWVRAEEMSALDGLFDRDPWGAWQDLALVPEATSSTSAPDELPSGTAPAAGQAVAMTRAPTAPALVQPPELPAGATSGGGERGVPVAAEEQPVQGKPAEGATERRPVRSAPKVPVFPTRPPPRPRRLRAWPPLLALVVGGAALAGVQWYVGTTADAVFAPVRTAVPAVAAAAVEAPVEAGEPPIDAAMASIEEDLRGSLLDGVLPVQTNEQLGDDLLIELRRVRLDVISIDADVTVWGGRKRDVPQRAEIRIRIRGRDGEIERELGGAALVVGKYVQHYSLELDRCRLAIERVGVAPVEFDLEGQATRALYLQRTSLAAFLAQLP